MKRPARQTITDHADTDFLHRHAFRAASIFLALCRIVTPRSSRAEFDLAAKGEALARSRLSNAIGRSSPAQAVDRTDLRVDRTALRSTSPLKYPQIVAPFSRATIDFNWTGKA
jgi:hypothetical protein